MKTIILELPTELEELVGNNENGDGEFIYVPTEDDIFYDNDEILVFRKLTGVAGNLDVPDKLLDVALTAMQNGDSMITMLSHKKDKERIIDGWIKRLTQIRDS